MEKKLFEDSRPGNDYSGATFLSFAFRNLGKSRSFFNGCNFNLCELTECDFSHSEFSEAFFSETFMENINFASADFVSSTFHDSEFKNCTFKTGEWRHARFINCKFIGCDFDHTTITLSEFEFCSFDDISTRNIQQRSIYLNIFHACNFSYPTEDGVFCAKNFGVPCSVSSAMPVPKEEKYISIEELCFRKNTRAINSLDFLMAVRGLDKNLNNVDKIKSSSLQFLTLAIRSASRSGDISSPALIQLENDIVRLASLSSDQRIYNLILSLALEIRAALRVIWSYSTQSINGRRHEKVNEIKFHFQETFPKSDAEKLANSLSKICALDDESFEIVAFKNGSTTFVIRVCGTTVLVLGVLLGSLSQVLRQVNEVVIEATKVVDNTYKLKSGIVKLGVESSIIAAENQEKGTISVVPVDKIAPKITELFSLVDEPAEIKAIRSLSQVDRELLIKMDKQPLILVTLKDGNLG